VGKPVHYLALQFPLLVTAHSEKMFTVWNLQNVMNNNYNPVLVEESTLKYHTTSIAVFGDGKGFVIGSDEGRCGVVDIDFNKQGRAAFVSNFTFKCHRDEKNNAGEGFTINSISFNTKFKTFATAGSDGTYIVWNKDVKSRYK